MSNISAVHQPRHLDAVSAVIRHFQILQQRRIGQCPLAISAAHILDRVLQALHLGTLLGVVEERQLIR